MNEKKKSSKIDWTSLIIQAILELIIGVIVQIIGKYL